MDGSVVGQSRSDMHTPPCNFRRHAYLVLRLESVYASARGAVDVAREAHLLIVGLVDEYSRVSRLHVWLVHRQDLGFVRSREHLLAEAVGRESGLEDAHALAATRLIGAASVADLLIVHAAAALVAVHAEVALGVGAAGVVELHAGALAIVLAATRGLQGATVTIWARRCTGTQRCRKSTCSPGRGRWGSLRRD